MRLTSSSLLLFVYCRYLCTVHSDAIHLGTSDVGTLKAIAGLNFTVRMINDATVDLNDQVIVRPHILAPCSPVTPYSAYHCLMVLSNFGHVIPDADERFHGIYCSLHFYARRWGVAGTSFFSSYSSTSTSLRLKPVRNQNNYVLAPFTCSLMLGLWISCQGFNVYLYYVQTNKVIGQLLLRAESYLGEEGLVDANVRWSFDPSVKWSFLNG